MTIMLMLLITILILQVRNIDNDISSNNKNKARLRPESQRPAERHEGAARVPGQPREAPPRDDRGHNMMILYYNINYDDIRYCTIVYHSIACYNASAYSNYYMIIEDMALGTCLRKGDITAVDIGAPVTFNFKGGVGEVHVISSYDKYIYIYIYMLSIYSYTRIYIHIYIYIYMYIMYVNRWEHV